MSLNGIRRDKNGKLLKIGQWVEGQVNKSPPGFIVGKLISFTTIKKGKGKIPASVIQNERRAEPIENKKIEIRIDL